MSAPTKNGRNGDHGSIAADYRSRGALSQLLSTMNTLTARLELEPSVTAINCGTATVSTCHSNTPSTSPDEHESSSAKISLPTK